MGCSHRGGSPAHDCGLALLALSLGLMHGIATIALRRLPGLTGDVYGAICELSQLAVWLAAPFVLRR